MSLDRFSPAVRAWFEASLGVPTPPQQQGWPAIANGDNTLIFAPTGSGKTLAAFLWGIDSLVRNPTPIDDPHTRIVYLSPLRALAVDVDKNLRVPLAGIANNAETLGLSVKLPTIGVRTGDTNAQQRRQIARRPPDILITTPESLYLMLTSRAREGLTRVETVIVDEIHALAGTKRGAHMAVSLERLTARCATPPQRIGLSATQRPLEETARFLGGRADQSWRPVTIIDSGSGKQLEVEVVVPVDDMSDLGTFEIPDAADDGRAGATTRRRPVQKSIWPAMHPELLDLIESNRSTLVFVNARRSAERLASQLNELADERDGVGAARSAGLSGSHADAGEQTPPLVRAHHGSISREQRLEIEEQLKSGQLRGLVATSSLELGIDMGAVDMVVQVESPHAVSRGLQRIGRAGHNVGAVSRGRIFPKNRADLLEATVVAHRMRSGLIESTYFLRNPLDVLAQQVVAMCALDDWTVADLATVIRGSANYAELSDQVLASVLDLLGGRYPSEEFSGLYPRIVWDRVDGTLRGRRGAQRLAVTNAGTIPDRGLFGVFLEDGTRVGELDEEMVHESRPGEVFLLGASSWRVEQITFDRVVVSPAPGEPGRMPFWLGDGPGRPLELGMALGEFVRELRELDDPVTWLTSACGLDIRAAHNLVSYLDDQATSTGVVPDDRTIVVERFRDEIGDWRVCVHTPFGVQVHAPWAMALRARMVERYGTEIDMLHSDDGIVLRLPDHVDELPADLLAMSADEVTQLVVDELPRTALFASRFREAAGRALLMPRRRPGQRTPLWQQRQRSADLLEAARDHPEFPLLLETVRECINDVFDLPALKQVLASIADGTTQIVAATTSKASPFAQSLLFGWVAVYMYEGDAPLAERRAAALALDPELLRELLGEEELRELLDADVLDDVELDLQRRSPNRQARDADELHDVLRELGPLTRDELTERASPHGASDTDPDGVAAAVDAWISALITDRRAISVTVVGHQQFAVAEDAGRLRDALGTIVPSDLPAVFLEPVDHPIDQLLRRYARTHGPFTMTSAADRFGLSTHIIDERLAAMVEKGNVVRGEFRPNGTTVEFCDDDVLRRVRRRSLAQLRKEVEPVDARALARFLPRWQGVGAERHGPDGLADVLAILQGAPIAASVLERDVLPLRLPNYQPADLDMLCMTGQIVWVGAESLGTNDGRLRLLFRDQAALLLATQGTQTEPPAGDVHQALREHLTSRGASFWPELIQACSAAGTDYRDDTVHAALWDLIWAGEITNDSLAPLRALVKARPVKKGRSNKARRRPKVGQLHATGPPSAAGRWSLVSSIGLHATTTTAAAHAQTNQLLERYGVLTREATLGEGSTGGFAGVYPVLRALEDQGKVRRGYFVAGLGAAQFALPGAVDRLRRNDRPATTPVVFAATDPAQPFGAALPWPPSGGRPSRSVGALVVIADGSPLVFVERGGKSLVTFAAAVDDDRWASALADAVDAGRARLELSTIDGESAAEVRPVLRHLETAGFTRGYKGWNRAQPR